MEKYNTITQVKKELKNSLKEDGWELDLFYYAIEISSDKNSDDENVIDFNLNIYFKSSNEYYDGNILYSYLDGIEDNKVSDKIHELMKKYPVKTDF